MDQDCGSRCLRLAIVVSEDMVSGKERVVSEREKTERETKVEREIRLRLHSIFVEVVFP